MDPLLASVLLALTNQIVAVAGMIERSAKGEPVTAAEVEDLQSKIDANTATIESLRGKSE